MIRQFIILGALVFLTLCGHGQVNHEKPKGVSFKVNDVQIADSLLKVNPAKQVFENKIGKEILFFPVEQADYGLVNCSNNGLIQTIQECYDNHRPLVLTPDIIWLAICQGVSIHINEHYDTLKNVIFTENKPDEIVVREDSLEYAAQHWKNLIAALADETRKYTRDDFYSFLVSEFSTTTAVEKTTCQIALLESYKQVFRYVGESGCGIPSIHIAGTQKDWQTILKKMDMLDQIGLSNWAKNLKPVIKEFIKASKGKPNQEFWQNIYKNATEYNGFYISGWIIKFFPYIKERGLFGAYDEENDGYRVDEIFIPNPFIDDDNYLLSTLSTDNFPSGISKVPLTWNDYFKKRTKKIEIYAGFFAIKQYPDKTLEPLISWVICDEEGKKMNHQLSEYNNRQLKDPSDYWSPHFAETLVDSAIYDIRKFKTQSASIDYVRSVILDALSKNKNFKSDDYLNDTIQVEILSNGKVAKVKMMKSENKQLENYIAKLIKELPKPWFPALAHPVDVLEIIDFTEEEENVKIRVNSVVKIAL